MIYTALLKFDLLARNGLRKNATGTQKKPTGTQKKPQDGARSRKNLSSPASQVLGMY